MKKSEREIVFNKFEGRCYMCGDALKPGWHVDHLKPCGRRYKIGAYSYRVSSKKTVYLSRSEADAIPQDERDKLDGWQRVYPEKPIPNGYDNPEANHVDNYMPSCASCNINKHGMDLKGFRESIHAYMKHLNEISTQYKIAKRYGLIEETNKPVVFYFETIGKN